MESMHPHWETTDETEQSVPVRIAEKKSPAISVPAAKRSSAALFGIAIIAIAGFFTFGGMDLFPAQVGSTAVQITITDSGISPDEILVKGGRRINWMNSSGIPHILSSMNLKDANGKLMETTAIFPGSDFTFDIPVDTPDGTYTYVSKTSPDISGRIVVQKDRLSTASSSSVTYLPYTKPVTSSLSSSAPSTQRPVYTPDYVPPSSSSSIAAATVNDGDVPQNPYTVGNTVSSTATNNPSSVAPVTEHRPTKQPESGTGLWIASLTGLAALLIVMRKASVSL
jgi:plastocyanin